VIHVFPAGLYLETDAGDVVVIMTGEAALGPLSIQVEDRERHLATVAPGMQVRWSRGAITMAGFAVRFDGTLAWEAHPQWEELRDAFMNAPDLLAWLQGAVLRAAPAGSFADFLGEQPDGAATRLLDAARPRAFSFVASLASAVNGNGPAGLDDVRRTAAALAGLGSGFTPAGDDYMMGAMHSMWTLLSPPLAGWVSTAVAETASPRTTTASAAYLRAAASGSAGEGWHELIRALRQGGAATAEAAVDNLAKVGHTSGADALAGFAQTLEAILSGQAVVLTQAVSELG
jgi:hypothetical protein